MLLQLQLSRCCASIALNASSQALSILNLDCLLLGEGKEGFYDCGLINICATCDLRLADGSY